MPHLRQCLARLLPRRRRRRDGARLRVESLEPRVLFSAELAPLSPDDASAGSHELRLLEPDTSPATALSETAAISPTRPASAGTGAPESAPSEQAIPHTDPAANPVDLAPLSAHRELVIVDARVPDAEALIESLRSAQPRRSFDILLVDPAESGLEQIARFIDGHEPWQAWHVLSHASPGALQLGADTLSNDTLEQHTVALAQWADALTASADILLYGCDLAASDDGLALLDALASITGADIAASDDTTGAASLGGDFSLEAHTGSIETSVALDALTQQSFTGTLATYTVTNINDSGAGSFRQAILNANANAGADSVSFSIAGTGIHSITPLSALPVITEQIAIDATTDDSFAANGNKPAIIIDGNDLAADGLIISGSADGSSVRGLVVRDFAGNGITLWSGADNVTIAGNYIGQLTSSGTASVAADAITGVGIWVHGANVTIGGATAADRNILSGNSYGVYMDSASATGNRVMGNIIGADITGTVDIGNSDSGVIINGGATGNTIGTDLNGVNDASEGNLISGNDDSGIQIWAANANFVRGNTIGLTASKTAAIQNTFQGIQIGGGSSSNVIGGTNANAANTIGGNGLWGVQIAGGSSNTVQGNFIGTNASASTGIGNTVAGVNLTNGTIGNTIGGTTAAARNIISGNGKGLLIEGSGTSGNLVQGNYIGTTPDGSAALANTGEGVLIQNAAVLNTIGGNTANTRNVISGNQEIGILVSGLGTDNNIIKSNYIGTNATGSAAISNGAFGVAIDQDADGTVVGGVGAGNVISGNTGTAGSAARGGVYLAGTNATIRSNIIGLSADTLTALPNGVVSASTAGIYVTANSTARIGGTGAGEGNRIAYNIGPGISAPGGSAQVFSALGNLIYENTGLALDLGNNGVTANDPGDGDSGANALQNTPTLASASNLGADLRIQGGINSNASTNLRIEFFSVPGALPDASGHGEAWTYLGTTSVTTNGSGDASFDVTLIGQSQPADSFVTATATVDLGGGTYGGTSEMAANAALGSADPVITLTPGNGSTAEGGLTYIVDGLATLTDDSPDFAGGVLTVQITVNGTSADRLVVAHQGSGAGQIGVAGSTVSYGGTAIATFTGGTDGATPLLITFNASADVAAVQAVLRRIGHRVMGEDPSTLTRSIAFTLSDGDGGTSATETRLIDVFADTDIWVTTTADTVDGNTSSIQALQGDRGADGRVSLREAMLAANATAGANEIYFDIPDALVGGAHTITPLSALPIVSGQLLIDARSEPDWSTVPVVELDGSSAGSANGLQFSGSGGDGSAVRGLAINRFASNGILVSGSDGFTLVGSRIGTDVSGSIDRGNLGAGVRIDGSALNATIGGNVAGDGNLVSGNGGNGIELRAGTTGTVIAGNTIGLAADGTTPIANGSNGILVLDAAGNTIGGLGAPSRNIISGNASAGIRIDGVGSTGNMVLGNYIGTTVTGLAAAGNSQEGVKITGGASANQVGDDQAGAGNIISGNLNDGFSISGASNNIVQNNWIGVDATGNAALANGDDGLQIGSSGTSGNIVGGSTPMAGNVISGNPDDGLQIYTLAAGTIVQGNQIGVGADGVTAIGNGSNGIDIYGAAIDSLIGGTGVGEGNVIAYSVGDGVLLRDAGTSGHSFLGNRIFGNGGTGLDLTDDGSTANDAGDPDTGPNDYQNYPVLGIANTSGGNTRVTGSLNSSPSTTYRIEFFSSVTGDASGTGEAETYLGATGVTTDAGGDAVFDTTLIGVSVVAGHIVTAMATVDTGGGNFGSSSEFAANVVATGGNLAPSIAFGSGGFSVLENSVASIVDGLATVSDLDSVNFDAGHLVVDFSANGAPEDRLGVADQGVGPGQVGVSGASITYGGTPVATYVGGTDGATPLDITFNTAADLAAVQAVMRRINYQAVGEDPNTLDRTIRFVLSDGDGGTSTPITKVIGVTADSDIWVTTTADTVDGDTSSLQALQGDRGADGRVSLREAMLAANATAGTNEIYFDIPDALVGGAHTIQPATVLPAIVDTVTIDATTEPDFGGTPIVQLDGSLTSGTDDGFMLDTGSDGSTIRGLVINRFAEHGIDVNGVSGITIAGNYIGTDVTGTTPAANTANGILVHGGASGVVIGGSGADGNLISGNGGFGIVLNNADANIVQGNMLGTAADGTSPLGNVSAGLKLMNGASDNLIGGDGAGEGNVIAFNTNDGVKVTDATTLRNSFVANVIHDNSGREIDLNDDGLSNNDANDVDSGPNDLQNFPVLTGAVVAGGNLTLAGTLDTDNPATQYRIDFFGVAAGGQEPNAHGGANIYLGSTQIVTDGAGDAIYSGVSVSSGGLIAGDFATAVATVIENPAQVGVDALAAYGESSEIATNLTIASSTAPVIAFGGGDIAINENDPPALIDPLSTVSDIDSLDFDGGHLVADVTANAQAGDRLTVEHEGNGAGQVGVSGNTIAYSGVSVATFAGGTDGATPLDIMFNTAADATAVQAVMRQVAFEATGRNPNLLNRSVRLVLSDGDGGTSTPISKNITLAGDGDIWVTTTADTADGSTSSLTALQNDPGADGRVSLREALLAANSTPNGAFPDQIHFDIPEALVGGAHTIQPVSALPTITQAVTIDGSSEPDFAGSPIIEIDGSGSGASGGLSLSSTADGTTIRGLVINRFTGSGILVSSGADNVTIAGNHIGTDVAGSTDLGNTSNGINVNNVANLTIGGATAADRNVISGNNVRQIEINSGATGVIIQGNIIGADATGRVPVGGGAGIMLFASSGVEIGGPLAGQGNIIGGLSSAGITLGTGAGATIRGNFIGTNAFDDALGNGGGGVIVAGAGATATLGGTAPGEGNVIAHNSGIGVRIDDTGNQHSILGNLIYANTGLGIDLGNDGPTLNDADDVDTGANGLLNFPVLSDVYGGASTFVSGSFQGLASTTVRLEFFASAAADPSGYGEGERYLGSLGVTTDASGNASFSNVAIPAVTSAGEAVSGTATIDLGGGNFGASSEFATSVTVTANAAPVLGSIEASPLAFNENDAAAVVSATIGVSDPSSTNLTAATVTISGNYVNGEDVLAFVDTATIQGAWNPGTGVLTLTGTDSVAAYQSALRTITYRNLSEGPSTATRTVEFVVTDGLLTSNTISRDIDVISVNDAPVLAAIEPAAIAYTENDPAVIVTSTITAADIDDSTLASATVAISSNYVNGEDVLAFSNTANITGIWSAATGVLTLTGVDSLVAYDAALRSVTYQNLSDAPTTATRTVSFTVDDGAGANSASNTLARDIALTGVNDAPMLVAIEPGPLSYSENDPATPITTALTIADPDSATMMSAVVAISANYVNGEDSLSFVNTASITGSWNAATGVLTLTGADSAANYQAALRSVTYQNGSDTPSTLTRTISFSVDDGAGSNSASNTVTRDITVVSVNDAPVLANIEGATLAYTENDPALTITSGITAADIDSGSLSSATISVSANYVNGEDVLAFTNTANITGSFNATTGVLTLSGVDTLAAYQAALRTVTYQNLSDDPSTAIRTISFTVDDGAGANPVSNTVTRDIAITAVNDAPLLSAIEAVPRLYTENDPAVAITGSLIVTDADSPTLGSATVAITANFASGEDILAFANTANISGSWNGATGVLTLAGADTVAAYQAALRSVTYQNLSDDPSAATRTVSFAVDDGGLPSNTVSRDITVSVVNDAPLLSAIEPAPLTVTEGDPATAVTAALVVSDLDDTQLNAAIVTISVNYVSGEDVLAFTDTANITGSWNTVSGVLTLTGIDTVAAYQAALRSVTYQNTSNDPSAATRTVGFVVTDGSDFSLAASRDIAITPVGDPPMLATIEGPALAITENDPASAITSTLTVADVDSPSLASATVAIAANYVSGEDVLAFTNTANITGSWNAATGVLTLSGADTPAAYQGALRSVTYQNTSDDPSAATRTVSFTVDDGGLPSNTVTRDVAVTAVNDAPALTGLEGAPLTYTENDPATAITTTLTVADPDSPTLASASVSISVNYVNGEDVLAFTNTANITGAFNAAAGVLTLTGVDTVAAYQAALRSVTYLNASDDPSTATRTVSFTVDDGAGANSASNIATRDIAITAVNDAPVLASIEPAPLAITENDPATALTATLTLSELDSTTLASATVSVSANYVNGEDVLAFGNTANITGAFNVATGVLTLSGVDTLAAYEAALRSVTYQNLSDDPSTATRTISFTVDDGAGAGANAVSNTVTRDVTITAVNDAPLLAGIEPAPLATIENDPATVITSSLTLTDPDSPTLASATVTVSTNYINGEDVLAFANTANITGSFNATTGVLTLSGADTVAAYQAALRSVTYQNLSDDPSILTRTVSLSVNDGAGANAASNVLTRDIAVSAVNDAPLITSDGAGPTASLSGPENSTTVTTVSAADPDSATLTFSIAGGDDAALFSIDPNTGAVSFASPPDFEAPLDLNADNVYLLTVAVDDGAGGSDSQDIDFTVSNLNEGPVSPLSDADASANQITEGSPNGSAVGITAAAAEPDFTTDSIAYSLDDSAAGRFAIDPASGIVTVADSALIDYESSASHSITIRATSSDGSFSTASFTIAVIDINDTAPVIDSASPLVPEFSPIGSPVAVLTAADPDTVGSLQNWTITGGSGAAVFAIDAATGLLSVADFAPWTSSSTPASPSMSPSATAPTPARCAPSPSPSPTSSSPR
ncbi:MAG: DUF4347 domain-containing protein [Burkholderiaceae bacterium]